MAPMSQRTTSPRVSPLGAGPTGLDLNQLIGRQGRLVRELAGAFDIHPFPSAMIERLVAEVAATEREIEMAQASQKGFDEVLRLAA